MMDGSEWWLVEVELKRIQTYLFSVPRLSAMIGANALVGETLRGRWGKRSDDEPGFEAEPRSLPLLAQQCKARWPSEAGSPTPDYLKPPTDDSLQKDGVWQDDVAEVACRTGVLTRDGGHFAAVFPTKADAEEFKAQAHRLITAQLPGVRLEVRIKPLIADGAVLRLRTKEEEEKEAQKRKAQSQRTAAPEENKPAVTLGANVFDLPQAEVCAWSGREPASQTHPDPGAGPTPVGQSARDRHERGQAFDRRDKEKQGTYDVLGILREPLLRKLGCEPEKVSFPNEFSRLSIGGYLAVVHVDGNSVGSRFTAHKDRGPEATEDFFAHWRHTEAFFHTLRVGFRRAVFDAIVDTFQSKRSDAGELAVRPLMLGGDDLVLVCAAPYALPFVVKLAELVKQFTRYMPDNAGRLTVGAGVAIVQDSFPFYRAHALAEQLATSAKRLKASLLAEDGNVVDWIVSTESWHGDIEDTRHEQFLVDKLVLSSKPYPILIHNPDPNLLSLQEMLADAGKLAEETKDSRAARSQMRRLAESLREGWHTSTFAASVLPQNLKEFLKKDDSRYLSKSDSSPWRPPSHDRYITRVLDFHELYELALLGQNIKQPEAEVANA